jgi:hypothetical protein
MLNNALSAATSGSPLMEDHLARIGRADALLDLHEASRRVSGILADIDALPVKVEFPGEDY